MTRLLLTTAVASVLALTGCIDVTVRTPAYATSGHYVLDLTDVSVEITDEIIGDHRA